MIILKRPENNIALISIQNNRSINKDADGCYNLILKHLMSKCVYYLCSIDAEPDNMLRFLFEADLSEIPDGRYSYYVVWNGEINHDYLNVSNIPSSCNIDCEKINVMASGVIEISCNPCCCV